MILSSPYKRAEQTARAFAKEIDGEVTLADFLISGMEPKDACAELAKTSWSVAPLARNPISAGWSRYSNVIRCFPWAKRPALRLR